MKKMSSVIIWACKNEMSSKDKKKSLRNPAENYLDIKGLQVLHFLTYDFQLEDNKHKEEEGKRAGEKERCSGVIVCQIHRRIPQSRVASLLGSLS